MKKRKTQISSLAFNCKDINGNWINPYTGEPILPLIPNMQKVAEHLASLSLAELHDIFPGEINVPDNQQVKK